MIVYANHPSWWDPMVAIFLARELWPQRRHYFPIDAAMLRKYPFFRRLGFFPVNSDHHQGARDFLKTGCSLLDDGTACLWLTPQGNFADVRQRPLCLKPGLAHLARRVHRAAIIPVAVEYPFWTERTPEALLRFAPPLTANRSRTGVNDWQITLTSHLQHAMDSLAPEATTHDPYLFHTLLTGTSGTSKSYDWFRRVRTLCAGQQFTASHLPEAP